MDIRNWGAGQKMQLPEHCFGQQWPVSVNFQLESIGASYDISEMALPDVAVVWFLEIYMNGGSTATTNLRLSLGDVLPTSLAQFNTYEPLFKDLGRMVGTTREFSAVYSGIILALPMRKLIHPQGRRLVGRSYASAVGTYPCSARLIVSGLPNEVPDCLLSG